MHLIFFEAASPPRAARTSPATLPHLLPPCELVFPAPLCPVSDRCHGLHGERCDTGLYPLNVVQDVALLHFRGCGMPLDTDDWTRERRLANIAASCRRGRPWVAKPRYQPSHPLVCQPPRSMPANLKVASAKFWASSSAAAVTGWR